jgi:hypothetical protein
MYIHIRIRTHAHAHAYTHNSACIYTYTSACVYTTCRLCARSHSRKGSSGPDAGAYLSSNESALARLSSLVVIPASLSEKGPGRSALGKGPAQSVRPLCLSGPRGHALAKAPSRSPVRVQDVLLTPPPPAAASALGTGALQELLGLCPRRHAGRWEERFPLQTRGSVSLEARLGPPHPPGTAFGSPPLSGQGTGAQRVLDIAVASEGPPQPPGAPDVPQRGHPELSVSACKSIGR